MPFDEHRAGGALFANTRKTAQNQPDFTGELVIDQQLLNHLNMLQGSGKPLKFRLAGWKKTSAKGTNFLSLSSSPDQEPGQRQQQVAPPATPKQVDPFDDDCPF